MYYAQINDDDIVTGVSDLAGEVIDPKMIEILSYDSSLLGKRWTGTEFEDMPIPEPTVVNIPTVDFWERFTSAEQDTLIASGNALVKRFLYRLQISTEVNLLDSRLITFVNNLETAGAIDPGRAEEILAV